MLAVSIIVLLCVLLAIGMPIAFAIAVAGSIGLYFVGGFGQLMSFLETVPLSGAGHYELLTIPMFILMAEFVIVSGVADDLFDVINVWVARVRGGLGISTILAGAAFGAICGSSAASAATLSATAIPQMTKRGYDTKLASGLTAIVGTLAVMIPPSNGLVIYGIVGEVNIGKLLIAGVVPGILGAITLILVLRFLLWRNPSLIRGEAGEPVSFATKLRMLARVLPVVCLFALVTGMLYLGVTSPTEAAALGAFGAFVLTLVNGKLTVHNFARALVSTASTTAMITFIIIGALIFGYFLTLTQTTQSLIMFVGTLGVRPWIVLLLIICIYLVLGCFLDQIAILVLTVPITLPIVHALGYDPVWFGIIVTLTSEIGLVTPPVGLNVFIVSRYTGTPVGAVFYGVTPYVVGMGILLLILAFIPEIVLWVPSSMAN